MKIAIIGSRGIPNHYGGFEQLAEYLSVGLVQRGHQVSVYNSNLHYYQEPSFHGVEIITCKDPENRLGTMGQFIYDFNCIRDSAKRDFDVILQLGYTSSSIWSFLLPKKAKIVTNMDGLEWKRSKYSTPVKLFLQKAESMAVKSSDVLIADSRVIQEYLQRKYRRDSEYVAYGADHELKVDPGLLYTLNLKAEDYCLVIARFEPENNLEMIIKGFLKSKDPGKLVLIGFTGNSYGKRLKKKYESANVLFPGAIYNPDTLHTLKHFCRIYFHGHSVGGTNPSLLEAMASGAFICAHDNPFNREVLGKSGWYFRDAEDVAELIIDENQEIKRKFIRENLRKVKEQFTWTHIIDQYEKILSL